MLHLLPRDLIKEILEVWLDYYETNKPPDRVLNYVYLEKKQVHPYESKTFLAYLLRKEDEMNYVVQMAEHKEMLRHKTSQFDFTTIHEWVKDHDDYEDYTEMRINLFHAYVRFTSEWRDIYHNSVKKQIVKAKEEVLNFIDQFVK